MHIKKTHNHIRPKDASATARKLADRLKRELTKTIAACKAHGGEYAAWSSSYFEPAYTVLSQVKKDSYVRALAEACQHMQVFGGMGSWSDSGFAVDGLYNAYAAASTFYQDCWANGIT